MVIFSPGTHLHFHQLLAFEWKNLVRPHLGQLKRGAMITGGAIGLFAVLNLAVLAASLGKVAPFTKVGGVSYSLQSIDTVKQSLADKHAGAVLTLSVQNHPVQLNAQDAGVQLLFDETLRQNHSGWRKLPLLNAVSNLLYSYQPVYAVDQQQLATSLKSYVQEVRLEPTEPTVNIPENMEQAVQITPETAGSVMNAKIAAEQVAYQAENNTFALKILPGILEPKWNTADYTAFLPRLEEARKVTLTIKAVDKEINISGTDLQKLLGVDTSGSQLSVKLDQSALASYLGSKAQAFYEAPVATRIGLRDGLEISRSDGVAGKALDNAKTAEVVAVAFQQGVLIGDAIFATVDPAILYARTYSNSDHGLYKLIEDFAGSHAGKYRVAAVELDGPGHRSAFYNADEAIITASTYKVFVAYAALLKVEQGEWTLNSGTSLGSLDHCMTEMIVVSDNSCAMALQDKLGWSWLDGFLKDRGFEATKLNNSSGGDKYSTVRDEMELLTGLYNSELVNTGSRDYLFGLMSRQIYRQGIVAGSGGSLVADKVGFLYDLYHDMGIVYSPKSTYALVIMTEGAGGFNNVRLLSEEIYDFYNQ